MCQFFSDGKPTEYVKSYTHLGHVIICSLNDSEDIHYRRRCLARQINSVLASQTVVFLTVFHKHLKTSLFHDASSAVCISSYFMAL